MTGLLQITAIFGFLAAAGVTWRTVSTWDEMDWLHRALAAGIFALLAVSTYGQWRQLDAGFPVTTDAIVAALVVRFVALLVVLLWVRLLGQFSLRGAFKR